MEQDFNKQYENPDPWRKAILVERENPRYDPMLIGALDMYEGERNNALILGDASLVQAEYLIEKERFGHVVDVDLSPTLLDDEIVRKDDSRLERIVLPFDQYDPSTEKFDLIYGKSIAFNPKETIQEVLKRLSEALSDEGMIFAIWAGEGDSFRKGIAYSSEEIKNLYDQSDLEILKMKEFNRSDAGLIRPGTVHEFKVLARKNTSHL